MKLKHLNKVVDSKQVSKLIESRFGVNFDIEKISLSECKNLIGKTNQMILEFKKLGQASVQHPTYMKLIMVSEAAKKRLREFEMKKNLIKALGTAAKGGKLTESQIDSLGVPEKMQEVLKNPALAQKFIRKVVESRKVKLAENNNIEQAQNTMAAQDIADQMQTMIEKFADVKYKEMPALHDSIRNSQGVEAAKAFNDSVVASLDAVTAALEAAKGEVNNAIAALAGEDQMDMDVDSLAGGDVEPDAEMDAEKEPEVDLGDEEDDGEMDFDLDLEDGDEEEGLGRERR